MVRKNSSDETQARDDLLSELSAKYREPLRRYFLRRIIDSGEAEDLTQELFVRIVRKSDLESVENIEAFLHQAAGNLLRDRMRRTKTAYTFMNEISQSRALNYEALSPERVLEGKESLDAVFNVLNGLEERTRDIFILHRIEGLTYAEIGKTFGISVSAVEKHISKTLVCLARYSATNVQE